MEEIIASPNKITTVSPRSRGPARCHQTSYANIKSYTRCHNIINGLLPIMPICLMILFSHLYVGSVVYGMTLYRWSLTFLDVKLVLTLPMSFNIWLRLFKVIKLWSSQMRISTWRYYWWSICHLLMSAWCAALRKESSSKNPVYCIKYPVLPNSMRLFYTLRQLPSMCGEQQGVPWCIPKQGHNCYNGNCPDEHPYNNWDK